MTGLLGGATRSTTTLPRAGANLDCFVAVPGLGRAAAPPSVLELQVPFGDGARALRRRERLPAAFRACRPDSMLSGAARPAALGAPGRARARAGADRRRDAAGARGLPRDARARDDDGRGRARSTRLAAGCSRPATGSSSPGSSPRSSVLADGRARRPSTTARSRRALLGLDAERGRLVTRDDLAAYEAALDGAGRGVDYAGAPLLTRPASAAVRPLTRLPPLRRLGAGERARWRSSRRSAASRPGRRTRPTLRSSTPTETRAS